MEEKSLQIFENSEFGKVRVIMVDGKPCFVAKDIAQIIDIIWYGASTIAHIPEQWKGVGSVPTPSGVQQAQYLTEEGLNFFLFRSDKPKALPFQMWLAGEVLPSINKHGGYILHQEKMSDVEIMAKAVLLSQSVIAEKEKQLQEAIRTKACISDRKVATALANSGAKTKQLNKALKEKEILSVKNKSLSVENESLKIKMQESLSHATVLAVSNRCNNQKFNYFRLMQYCKKHNLEIHKVYDERYGTVNSYPAQAWKAVCKIDITSIFNKSLAGRAA